MTVEQIFSAGVHGVTTGDLLWNRVRGRILLQCALVEIDDSNGRAISIQGLSASATKPPLA